MKIIEILLAIQGVFAKDICTELTDTYMECQEECMRKRDCHYWTWVQPKAQANPNLCTFLLESGWDTIPNEHVVYVIQL